MNAYDALTRAILKIEKKRDDRWHEEGGSHAPDTNEPVGGSHISDWMEGLDDAVEVVTALRNSLAQEPAAIDDALDALAKAFGNDWTPEQGAAMDRVREVALRIAPQEPVGAQDQCPKCQGDCRESPCAYPLECGHPCRSYIAERNQALLAAAQPQGARAVALLQEARRLLTQQIPFLRIGNMDRVEEIFQFLQHSDPAHLPAPQEGAKVPEGWKLVCEKCGADRGDKCGWPSNCPVAPSPEGNEESNG